MARAPDDSIRVSVEIPTTRVYAHVTAETQVALHNPMASQKVNPLADKYQFNQPIATLDDNAFLEVGRDHEAAPCVHSSVMLPIRHVGLQSLN